MGGTPQDPTPRIRTETVPVTSRSLRHTGLDGPLRTGSVAAERIIKSIHLYLVNGMAPPKISDCPAKRCGDDGQVNRHFSGRPEKMPPG